MIRYKNVISIVAVFYFKKGPRATAANAKVPEGRGVPKANVEAAEAGQGIVVPS